jgi:hypothetical protein
MCEHESPLAVGRHHKLPLLPSPTAPLPFPLNFRSVHSVDLFPTVVVKQYRMELTWGMLKPFDEHVLKELAILLC